MIYVSIDIETTGLDTLNDQVLEVAAIIEDTEKQLPFEEIPKFEMIINHKRLTGSPFALNLNQRIIKILSEIPTSEEEKFTYFRDNKIVNYESFALSFFSFLTSNGYEEDSDGNVKIIVAGKNFSGFDKPFLEKIFYFNKYIKFYHRSIDPAPLFTDFINDDAPVSLDECKIRAGIEGEVTHKAIDDAWDVIQVLRKKY